VSVEHLGVAILGVGGVSLANHIPGLLLCPSVGIVALGDPDPQALDRGQALCPDAHRFADPLEAIDAPGVDAVVIATPNVTHRALAVAAALRGKHVLCEKPIALTLDDARAMHEAAVAANVRHMTAFTYRFVPGMRHLKRLVDEGYVGRVLHLRAKRLQDWAARPLGWRQQQALAGTGELGDMLAHRLDFGHYLVGPIARVMARLRRIHDVRGGAPSDVDDWVGAVAEFASGATGVFESAKTCPGRGDGATGQDFCEVNGTEGSAVYELGDPHHVKRARHGEAFARVPVPRQDLTPLGSTRDPLAGDPLVAFRHDQAFEFVAAIREGRECRPSFADGVRVQAVIEAMVRSDRERREVEVSATRGQPSSGRSPVEKL
jgi:predicted dehydrogenase